MNWLDIAIVAVVALLGFVGLRRGIIRTAFGIAGLIGGIALAGRYYGSLASVLSSADAVWAKIAAYAIILVAVLVIASVIGWFVARIAHIAMLGWVDRLVGCMLGVFIGGMLCAAVLAILGMYHPGMEAVIAQSPIASFLMGSFPLLLALLPEEFDLIREFLSQ